MSLPTQFQRVMVNDIVPDGSYAICTDRNGAIIEVPLTMRVGKGGWPQIGEVWIITRQFGGWSFAALLGEGQPPVIDANRDDTSDLAVQLLEALIQLGLVQESLTDFADQEDYDTVYPPPSLLDPNDDDGDDPIDDPDPDPADVPAIPTALWLGTFNTEGLIRHNGPIIKDLKQILKTQVQVLGLQEMYRGHGYRDDVENFLNSRGWEVSHREDGPAREWNWITWKKAYFTLIAKGDKMLTPAPSSGPGIARWATWVRLKHLGSGQKFTFICTHLVPPARQPSLYLDQTQAVADLIDEMSAFGPTFVVGDFNANYRDPDRRGHAGWSGVVFPAHGTHANWELLGEYPNIGTHGFSLIDYIYRGPAPAHVVRYEDQKILRGCGSDHKPVIVKVNMRRVDTGDTGS